MALPRASRVTFGRARRLRKNLTSEEKTLWYALRLDALGVRFRRQHPIGPYIADFACYPLKLVVEVDGKAHDTEDARRHDAERDAYLRRNGWVVLRFGNTEVRENLDGVVEAIEKSVRNMRGEDDRPDREQIS